MNSKLYFSLIIMAIGITGIRCFGESGLPALQYYEKGLEKQKQEKRAEAFAYFKLASKKDPPNPLYSWAAATAADNKNDAFVNAEDAWRKGMKRPEVLFLRAALSLHTTKQEALAYTLSGYNEMPDTIKTPQLRGDIFFRFGEFDSALALWGPLYAKTPSGDLSLQISLAYSGKGNFQKARRVLMAARAKRLLDRRGYGALAAQLAFAFDYKTIDTLFFELRQQGLFNDTAQLDYSDFLLVQERYSDAEKTLDRIKLAADHTGDNVINFQARTRLYLIYCMLKQPENIRQLASLIPTTSLFLKQEQLYAKGVLDFMSGTSKASEEIEVSRKSLPNSSAINLLYARINADAGNLEKAATGYAALPALSSRSPRILSERATLLYKSGKDDDALALISDLHGRNFYSKQSLELFRDIMLKKKIMEKGLAAQKMLEKHYAHDAGVLVKKGMLALEAGKYDTALSVFTALSKEYTQEENFEALRISVFMIKKDYERVIRECSEKKASSATLAPLQARALERLGRAGEAKQVFQKACGEMRTKDLLLEYAFFLLDIKQPDTAAAVFDQVIAMSKKDKKTDKNELALLYNDLAWALVTSGTSPSKALDAARRAHDLSPDNLNILDTYSEALIMAGKYDDCISLFKNNPAIIKEPQLLYRLGTAYEKKKYASDACKIYSLALSVSDSASQRLKVSFDKSELTERLEALKKAK
jgi:predicted Zn-dependent protease